MATAIPCIDVLIVGAGPVGLMAACEFQRFGIDHRIIERRAETNKKSKAAGIWSRSLEALDMLCLADRFVEEGVHVQGISLFSEGRRLAHMDLSSIASIYNYLLILPQCRSETLMREHYGETGRTVEMGVELTSFVQDDDGVTCILRSGDQEEQLRCRYLLGCDGISSAVRTELKLPFEGDALAEDWLVGDMTVEGPFPGDEVFAFFDEDGPLVFFPMGKGRYRIIGVANERLGEAPSLEEFQEYCDRRTKEMVRLAHPRDLGYFKIQERQVSRYRVGRVFLAGDAAHVHSPAGGQGMNTGMQDAHNLAWKLAMVLKGQCEDGSILDSYHEERHPIAASVIKATGMSTKMITIKSKLGQHIRNKAISTLSNLSFLQDKGLDSAAETSINYRSGPLAWEPRKILSHTWLFKGGVAPGNHAPDAALFRPGSHQKLRLRELFRSPRFQLLLFSGAEQPDWQQLVRMAQQSREDYGELMDTHLIIHGETLPADLVWDGSVLLDSTEEAHHAYAAAEGTLYLIRPDRYVATRHQPASDILLADYLHRLGVKKNNGG